MTVNDWLLKASDALMREGIGSARLDALILLEDCLEKDRSIILAHPETVISKTRLKKLNSRLKRRAQHAPMAYIRGFTEFYGRKFKVNSHVLEPRPESETMIDLLKKLKPAPGMVIADVGTGSGCLGITAALELNNYNVDLYDIDAHAIAVARHNIAMHELRLKTYKKDLLRQPPRAYGIILANLPYVPNHFKVNQAAAMEPRIAIFGGGDGLDIYRRLFEQLARFSWQPNYILAESLPNQHKILSDLAGQYRFEVSASEGFIQVFTPS